jgi:hypothetical protein
MKKIPFTIEIRNKSYSGHLTANDLLWPPKNYLVFMKNHMIGELVCGSTWTFTQRGWHKILGNLDKYEGNEIAEYLGDIVDLFYKEMRK